MPVTDADLTTLIATRDIISLGMRADEARRERHGLRTTFVRVAVLPAAPRGIYRSHSSAYRFAARPTCRRLFLHTTSLPCCRAFRSAGTIIAISIAMMEMTTKSSMSVNALVIFDFRFSIFNLLRSATPECRCRGQAWPPLLLRKKLRGLRH